MRISICSFILSVLLHSFSTTASAANDSPRVPLHWLWHAQQTDSAYTVDADRLSSMVRERGYVDMGIIAYVDLRQSPDTRPLKCFYSALHTNTFCSISRIEQRTILSMGYRFVGDEGYVRAQKASGAVALFRLSRAYGDFVDREHRFATSEDELVRLRKEGWTYDGTKGYVFMTP